MWALNNRSWLDAAAASNGLCLGLLNGFLGLLVWGLGCLGADLAVEIPNVGTNTKGEVRFFLEVNAVEPAVGKDVLAGLEEVLRPFFAGCVVGHVFWREIQALGDVVESGEVVEGLGGAVEVAVDVGAGFVELAVVGQQGVEGVAPLEFEAGQLAYLAHGLDEGGAALDPVGMDAVLFGDADVVVPLLAQAAVARGGVVEFVGERIHVGDGLEVELGLLVGERVGVVVERV